MKLPFVKGSETSEAAAKSMQGRSTTDRYRVLDFLISRGVDGATDEEIQNGLPLNPSTQRPRRVGLVNQYKVRDSGVRRPTESGRSAPVWIAN